MRRDRRFTGESHMVAHLQSDGDGATIVCCLNESTVYIWIHWRELDAADAASHYMKSIFDCTLHNEEHISRARKLLWNHIECALDSRLRSLKDALPWFYTECSGGKPKTTRATGSSRASVLSNSIALATVSLPPTPSSTKSHRNAKRPPE